MRLIDADALIDDIKNHLWDWGNVNGITAQTVLKQTITDIENQPAASPWHRVEDELPDPNIQCLVRDDDNNCAVGYYRQDARAWDSPFFGWVERDDEYYEDGDLCRIGKVVAWMPIEPPKEDA